MFDFGISSFFNPGKAYKKAEKAQKPYYEEAQNYLKPWEQQGQEAYGPLQTAMQRLLNPQDLTNEWAQGYETSPYARDLMEESSNTGMQYAQQMGLGQSTPALRAVQAESGRISNADRENYLNRLLQQYMSGANLAQGIYGQGGQFAQMLGQNANQQGERAGGYAYGKQAAPGNMFGALLGTAAGFMVPGAGNAMSSYLGNQPGQQNGAMPAYQGPKNTQWSTGGY